MTQQEFEQLLQIHCKNNGIEALDADKTAKLSGIQVCGVYDLSSEDYINDIKSVADYYIYDFSEILELEMKKES